MRERHREILLRLEFGLEDIESDLKILSSACCPDHLEALEVERESIRAEIAARSAAKEAKSMQTQWGADTQGEIETLEAKVKVKTRATTESEESSTGSASDIVEDDKPEPLKVAVSRGAFSIFQAMFPTTGNEYGTRVVKWSAFVNAMAEGEVGFVARHNGGGSAFTFEPNEMPKWKRKGKIVLHKPHPTPELDSVMLLINGKRRSKWFGWSKETFVLK
jgi:hypothetical protein